MFVYEPGQGWVNVGGEKTFRLTSDHDQADSPTEDVENPSPVARLTVTDVEAFGNLARHDSLGWSYGTDFNRGEHSDSDAEEMVRKIRRAQAAEARDDPNLFGRDVLASIINLSQEVGDMWRSATARATPISVGIVGAGFAGLRCADVLLQHGYKVTIFEARNRLGGRVAQSEHLGHAIDLGPNWIHGTDDNPIMELARATQTQLHETSEKEVTFDSNGNRLPAEETHQYNELLWSDGLIAEAFLHSNQNHDHIDPQKSLYDFFEEKVAMLFKDETDAEAERKRKTLLQMTWLWSSYIGSPVTRQSLKFFWLEECIEGENPFVSGTYSRILEAVAKTARDKAEIRFETEVTGISGACKHRGANDDPSLPSITTADGSRYTFDEIVVTMPLGWLKENKSAFEPTLPPRLSQAIDNISYGHLDKVYITFPSAFWKETSHAATDDEAEKQQPGFVHFLHPNYAASTNPHQWNQLCMNYASMTKDCAHPTLLFYIQGPQSKYIANIVYETPDAAQRDQKLLEFFEPYYSRLPNYSAKDDRCVPEAVLATAWANDKFAGYGSYSNFQVGLERGDKDIETMRDGMPDRGVWLAGEHTAPFVALGTSTGAYLSGQRVAARIMKMYATDSLTAQQAHEA